MLSIIHQTAFITHIVVGGFALILFWLPILAKKGSQQHKKYGQYFVNGMYAISISGFIMTILVLSDPIGVREPLRNLTVEAANSLARENRLFATFLFMLSLLVFNCVYHSVAVLKAKQNRAQLKNATHVGLNVFLILASIIVGIIGIQINFALFMVFSGLCLFNAIGCLKYIFKANIKQREWIIEHMSGIFGAGIGAYTAFFVFGGSRIFTMLLDANSQIILWVLPGVVGLVASAIWSKKFTKQFKIA